MAEADETVDVEAFAIRASMDDTVRHLPKENRGNGFAVEIEYAGYTAHNLTVMNNGLIERVILLAMPSTIDSPPGVALPRSFHDKAVA